MSNKINRLAEIRFYRRINQHELALKCGISQSLISKLENELLPDTSATREMKKKISEALGLPFEKVFPARRNNAKGIQLSTLYKRRAQSNPTLCQFSAPDTAARMAARIP